MLALLPRAAAAAPFLESDGTDGPTSVTPPPTLAALAARASLPAPRLIFLGGGQSGGGGGAAASDGDPAAAAEAGTPLAVHPGLAVAHGAAHAAHTARPSPLACALVGRIANLPEVASLYSAELSSDGEGGSERGGGGSDMVDAAAFHAGAGGGGGAGAAGADLLLDVAMRGFPDASGDASDQPATFFAALRGPWAAVLVGEGSAGGLHVIVARGAAGVAGEEEVGAEEEEGEEEEGEEEEEEGGGAAGRGRPPPQPPLTQQPPPPLYWGAVEGGGVVVATTPTLAPASPGDPPIDLTPFPAGCFWEAGRPGGGGSGGGGGGLSLFGRPSPSTRPVQPLARRDSRGRLCGVAYRSKSGRDLAAGGGGGDAMVE